MTGPVGLSVDCDCFVLENASINDNPPIRPTNIRKIMIYLDATDKLAVMPLLNPTVAIAETVSNSVSAVVKPSIVQMAIVARITFNI